MSSLTACPSPQGEKPEGTGELESAAASLPDAGHGSLLAAAPDATHGSSEISSASPTSAALLANDEPAQAGPGAGEPEALSNGMEEFQRLRRRLLVSTLVASSSAVPICWLLFDLPTALSLLVGAVAGLLYLVLLARSVARLGGDRRSIGKVQLLVPVVLVLASSRIHQLELVPALVGFLLYKPALLVQAYLDR